MLERLGAYTFDAEEIANRVILKGAPGYQPVVNSFGKGILDPAGQVDRSKLYNLVREDRRARETLQSILDPLVLRSAITLINHSRRAVVVIQGANLSRYGLLDLCDHVWVTTAPEEVQIVNLIHEKGWSANQARDYVHHQPEVDAQLAYADYVLYNRGSRGDLLRQVTRIWRDQLEPAIPERTGPVETAAVSGPVSKHLPGEPQATGAYSIPPAAIAEPRVELTPPVEFEIQETPGQAFKGLKAIGRRVFSVLATLLVITYLTSWGLILAERGRERLPAQPLQAAWQALLRVGEYLVDHPQTYYWHKEHTAALQVVFETLKPSAGLLLMALGVAMLVGLPLGLAAALAKRKTSAALVTIISTLGISTPSFLFAMFLWVANIWVHRTFDIAVLPSGGFGWDAHLVMPVLVLAMRPLAQIAQVTYVSMRDILGQDYIRTAHSKGLSWRQVRNVHALPNILIPTLTTMGSSLRFSLASLPIVELFFDWPGVGLMLLDAIQTGNGTLVTDLILSLGLFFLFVNLVIEFTFPLIDARLRADADTEEKDDYKTVLGWIQELRNAISSWLRDIRQRSARRNSSLPPLPSGLTLLPVDKDKRGQRQTRRQA